MAMSLSTTYTGIVAAVNPKGLRLDGHEGWYNVSKFATEVILPTKGETVTVSVDSKGFLRSCELADGSQLPRVAGGSDAPTVPTSKDRTITRLAVLKAAAEYSASKPTSSSADVIKIAASWERWVLRDPDPTEDNVDAF
jgi:hypothetical protein